jgi:hypothetical protein
MFRAALPRILTTTISLLLLLFTVGWTTSLALAQTGVNTDLDLQNPPGGGVVTPDNAADIASGDVTVAEARAASGQTTGGDTVPISPIQARNNFIGFIYSAMITIGGAFTWVGGNMLDYAVEVLVVRMGFLLQQNIGVAVDNLWIVVRDIFNILFIFALIWTGLLTIIKADDGVVQRALPGIIIAALMVNFSLFITKSIVDFTNIAATQIYSAFAVPENAGTFIIGLPVVQNEDGTTPAFESSNARRDISVAFVQNMRLSSFAAQLNDVDTSDNNTWQYLGFGFLMMIVLIIAGFVFLAGAIMLIIRFVTLIIMMIFSPVMFLGMVLPQFNQWTKKWWNTFLKSAFVAPAYLFMLYLCLTVFTGLTPTGTFAGSFGLESISNGSFAIFLYFGAMVGFLIAATRVASSMSAYGGQTVTSVGMVGANYFRQAARNVGNAGYRNTAGRYYQGSADALERAREKKASDERLTLRDRQALVSARVAGAGSLDTAAASYKAGAGRVPFGDGVSRTQMKANQKSLKSSGARKKATGELVEKIKSNNPAEIEQAFSDMSNAQLLEIAKSSATYDVIKDNAQYLSGSQFKALADSDDVNDDKTSKIAEERQKGTAAKFAKPEDLKKAGKDDLAALGHEFLKKPENAVRLKDDQIKNLDVIETYKNEIKKARKDALIDIVTNGANVGGLTYDELAKMKPADIADLPDEVFGTSPNGQNTKVQAFIDQLPFTALTEIAKRKNKETQKIIKAYLDNTKARQDTRGAEMRDYLSKDPVGRRFGQ